MKTSHAFIWMATIVLVGATGGFIGALLVNGPPPSGNSEQWAAGMETVWVNFFLALILILIVKEVIFIRPLVVREGPPRPRLCRWGVSGVTALCRAEDFEKAEPRHTFSRDGQLNLRVVPRTMTFSKFRHRNMTGTMEDMAQLVEGCVVEDRLFFVPHSSEIFMSYEEQETAFPYVHLDEAYNLVWRGCRQPVRAAA